jgi:apolipoprotein N-acyltransferase
MRETASHTTLGQDPESGVNLRGKSGFLMQRFANAVAVCLGLLSATGFAPLNLWPLTLLSFAVLVHLVFTAPSLKSGFARGYCFGFGHFCVSVNWIAGAFRYQDSMPLWLGWVAVGGLALFIAIFPALASVVAWRWGRHSRPVMVLIFAAAWVVTEYLRATLLTGFAWNPLGVAFVGAGSIAKAIGTYGLSGVVMLAAGGLWLLIHRRWIAGLAAFALPALSALGSFAQIPDHDEDPSRPMLRIVQPNIAQHDKYRKGYEGENFRKLESLTGTPGPVPRLILWPEAAVPDYLGQEQWARERVASLLGPDDVLISGADDLIYDKADNLIGAHNSAFILNSVGKILGRYDKAHLVPGGEYLPLRWLMVPLGASRLVPGDIDFWEGPGPRAQAVPGFGKVGIQICYEIIFSGEVVKRADRPDFIFNPSNDAWFGTWQPPQHLAQSRLRALEEGLPVVRSTPTGISAIIDADGTIVEALPYQKPGFIEAPLPRAHEPTLFARYGNILPLAFAAFLALIGIALRRRVS